MPRTLRVLLSFLPMLIAAACVAPPHITLVPRVARFEVDGDIAAEDPGGSISGRSDAGALGLDEEIAITPAIEVDLGDFHISGVYTGVDFSGSGMTESTLRFRGNEILVGTPVDSDFEVSLIAADVVYDLIPTGDVVDIGVGVGIGALTYDLAIRSTSGPAAEVASDDSVAIGYLVLRVATPRGPVRIVAHARGLTGKFQDDEATYLDFDGRLAVELWAIDPFSFSVHIGYRHMVAEYKHRGSDGRLEFDVTISGPYVGVDIAF